jgi:predicted RNA polymerase sigma factor
MGREADAAEAYGRALELAHDDAERRLIDSRLRKLGERSGGQPAT